MANKPTKMWTKEEMRKVIKMWDTATVEEISKELRREKSSIQGMVGKMRKSGIEIARKHRGGYINNLIKELAEEYA